MTQNRPPPAYQEYAASMLSNMTFRMMSLSSRGLLYTLRLEYWIGNPLPANPESLSKVLGLTTDEVVSGLQELCELIRIDQGFVKVPELDDYKNHLLDRQRKQSEGGKEGARRAKSKSDDQKGIKHSDVNPMVDHELPLGSTSRVLVQSSKVKPSPTQISQVINEEHSVWLRDHDRAQLRSS
jgi:hypothetical protein